MKLIAPLDVTSCGVWWLIRLKEVALTSHHSGDLFESSPKAMLGVIRYHDQTT